MLPHKFQSLFVALFECHSWRLVYFVRPGCPVPHQVSEISKSRSHQLWGWAHSSSHQGENKAQLQSVYINCYRLMVYAPLLCTVTLTGWRLVYLWRWLVGPAGPRLHRQWASTPTSAGADGYWGVPDHLWQVPAVLNSERRDLFRPASKSCFCQAPHSGLCAFLWWGLCIWM